MIAGQGLLKLPPVWDLSVMPGALDVEIRSLERLLTEAGGTPVRVDLSALERFDSCGLAALLELQRCALRQSVGLHWQAMPDDLLEIARVYGVSSCFLAEGDDA
ncbi:MAG: STAS domain-containing protein [Betaproteobacteria bacterium]|nr:STAS domain-containing protein [Betaproteobacteria bacterium]NCW00270.1 STAS domain-containing protein [Betaproteobacteria bacterium]NCW33096.1 STAS domain-containing protein [Betaproteobacteria bacterium]NCX80732.1 STAS domain-containing protein [Betaproteobacteria bacterium]NCZ29069.1 STAS domain-containing protein [Betaproteobacteria bacterium]